MGEERKKSETRVDSEGAIEEVAADHGSAKTKTKKEKSRENKDRFSGEDVEITEKSGDDALVKKKKSKKKKKRVDSDAEDVGKKSKKKSKEIRSDSEAGSGVKNSETRVDSESENGVKMVDSEADDDKKKKMSKKESGGDEIVMSESSRVCEGDEGNQMNEKPMENTDAKKETWKRKLNDTDFGAEDDNTDKEMKRKSKKKKKPSVDSEVEENSSDSPKYAKKKRKEKKLSEDPEVEENNDTTKDAEKQERENSEADLISAKDAKKKKKKKKSEGSEAEENNNGGKKVAKKKRKKKQSDEDVTTPSSKSAKKVKFSDQVEVFPSEDGEESEEEDDGEGAEMVRGKRFTQEEDDLVKNAVYEYIDNHALGDDGLKMVLECKSYPQIRGCWKEIESALPWRPKYSVYHRAHTLFEAGSKGTWNEEDFQLVKEFQKKHGNDWRTLAEAMGKNRKHVKDAWRRIRLAAKKKNGNWSREEYQTLFDLVNRDIRMKAFQEKHSKHGMLRDNIPWMAISDKLGLRNHTFCCVKWYDQLTSPMVAKGVWANVDDYRLLDELTKLDAACVDDVDWDNLLDNRDGEACRKRWNQMVTHIGLPGTKTFAEQVEILSNRYCPDIAEDREDFDNRPFDDRED